MASIHLAKVELMVVSPVGRKGEFSYGGIVRLRAEASNLAFEYAYKFMQASSVPEAIKRAAGSLKQELQALAAATEGALQAPAQESEEDAEGRDYDQ